MHDLPVIIDISHASNTGNRIIQCNRGEDEKKINYSNYVNKFQDQNSSYCMNYVVWKYQDVESGCVEISNSKEKYLFTP